MDNVLPKHLEDHAAMPAVLWPCGGAFCAVDRSVWIPQMIDPDHGAVMGESVGGTLASLHGSADITVPITNSENLYNRLKEFGVPAEYYFLEGGDARGRHVLSKSDRPAHRRIPEKGDGLTRRIP